MDPDQTAPTGSRFTLFIYEASNCLVDDKSMHFVIMGFKETKSATMNIFRNFLFSF